MSSDAERLLIQCGLTQYTSRFVAANMNTYGSMQAKRTLIPALVGTKEHADRITAALGIKGTADLADGGAPLDPIEHALEEWERQIRSRMRSIAERQAALMLTRVPAYRRGAAVKAASSGSRADVHDLVSKLEHCKTLLAAVHSGRRAHRKIVELSKLLRKYQNRAGDPAEVDIVKQQLNDNAAYVQRILVTLEEDGKLFQEDGGGVEDGDGGFFDPCDTKGAASSTRPTSKGGSRGKQTPHRPHGAPAPKSAPAPSSSAVPEGQVAAMTDALWAAAVDAFYMKRLLTVAVEEMEHRLAIERLSYGAQIDLSLSTAMVIRF